MCKNEKCFIINNLNETRTLIFFFKIASLFLSSGFVIESQKRNYPHMNTLTSGSFNFSNDEVHL